MAVVQDAPRLRRSWLVRLRPSSHPAEVAAAVEGCLAELERDGRDAFNVYPSYCDAPAPATVEETIVRLRRLGATSGVARDPDAAPARVQLWRGP